MTFNPLVSILHKKVYSIPSLLIIGWRGAPGFKDEPQHVTKGMITKKLLKLQTWKIQREKTQNVKKGRGNKFNFFRNETIQNQSDPAGRRNLSLNHFVTNFE